MTDQGDGASQPTDSTPSRHAPPSDRPEASASEESDAKESPASDGLPPFPPSAQTNDRILKPGVVPLRPLNVGDILDGAVTTIRKYPAHVLGMSALIAVINAALMYAVSLLTLDDLRRLRAADIEGTNEEQLQQLVSSFGNFGLVNGAGVVIAVLTNTFLTGFLTVIVGKAVLGRAITVKEAIRELKPRFFPLLGLSVLYAAMVIVGAIFFLAPGVWVYVLLSLATPALVLERVGIRRAFRRSAQLTSGSWWRVFGVLLIGLAVSYLVAAVIELPFGISGGVLGGAFSTEAPIPTSTDLLLESIAGLISSTITAPFAAGITALLYIDQRMRKEGMDIQLARSASATNA